jgi:hypothetical protein
VSLVEDVGGHFPRSEAAIDVFVEIDLALIDETHGADRGDEFRYEAAWKSVSGVAPEP